MLTVGIDQSLTGTGITVLRDDTIIFSDVITTVDMRGLDRLDYICKFLYRVISEQFLPGEDLVIVREGYSYGSPNSSSVFELGELGGVIDMMIYTCTKGVWSDREISLYIIPPPTWKLMIFGNGSVKKDTSYLLRVHEATGMRFMDDNIADSYMLAKSMERIMGLDMSGLDDNQKYSLIAPAFRKKNKITKANIKKQDHQLLATLLDKTLLGLRRI